MSVEIENGIALARRLPHKSYDHAQLILAAGKRGQGKTTFIREYLSRYEPRVVALDPFGDFDGMPIVSSRQALSDLDEGTPCRRRVCPPINAGSRDYARVFFEACIDRLRNCLLVLDEMTLWSSMRADTSLETLVLQGRRLGLRMLVGCQRIALVPGVLLSESTDLVLFRMRRPRDLVIVEEWADKNTAQVVKTLTTGLCIHVET